MAECVRAPDTEPLVASDPPPESPPAPVRRTSALPMLLFRRTHRRLLALNVLLSVIGIGCCFSATFFTFWRIIKVNRPALLLLDDMGQLPPGILNMSIAYTRAQTIFKECTANDQNASMYETSYDDCRSLTADLPLDNHSPHFHELVGFYDAMTVLAPFISLVIVFCLALDVFGSFGRSLRRFRIYFSLAIVRMVNILLFMATVAMTTRIHVIYDTFDPGFPIPWPLIIRKHSYLFGWQWGSMLWTFGIFSQCFSMAIDMYRALSFYWFVPPLPVS